MLGLRHAAIVTSISRFTSEHLSKLGVPAHRTILLYPGVTPENWAPTGKEQLIRERFGLAGKRVLLSVSRLIPRKGQDVVLRALPEVLRRVPEAVYLIVGGGPEEERLRTLARTLGIEQNVRFVGSIPNSEAVDYYHAADVFVMPNRAMPNGDVEGFGLVFLEANACGLPVIGGRSGGTPDAIAHERSGYLVDPTSAAEVAARLVLLLTDSELRSRLGEQGRERVYEQFTWSATGRTLHAATEMARRQQMERLNA
jgi:phosphatidylinositol alpha-1,6-mannosyltransferase